MYNNELLKKHNLSSMSVINLFIKSNETPFIQNKFETTISSLSRTLPLN